MAEINFFKKIFFKHITLKITALILALVLWFYIQDELNKESAGREELIYGKARH